MHTPFLPREALGRLLEVLAAHGYDRVGPRLRDGAIVYEPLDGVEDLPTGWRQRQAPGEYHLEQVGGPRQFAWANGPQALKPLTFAPRETLWHAEQDETGKLTFSPAEIAPRPTAVLGVRACDLAALKLQEAHFMDGIRDEAFTRRRENLLLIAVNCSHPAETCFCAATGDGPKAESGYDLVMSELDEGFLIDSGSEAGEAILADLPLIDASEAQREQAREELEEAARQQTRSLPDGDLNHALFANLRHPRWDEVAERCLSCGNCTAVCPTCFCHSEAEVPALNGRQSEHVREWDSCFTAGHSYIHGIVIRGETKFRYRQWLTHKLGSWQQQYGRSGCVGCGRCISWCPVGIDLTEEVNAICGPLDSGKGATS